MAEPSECPHGPLARQAYPTPDHEFYPCRQCRSAAGLVECDDYECVAKLAPVTLEEWKAAAIHWQDHRNGGCSHGY